MEDEKRGEPVTEGGRLVAFLRSESCRRAAIGLAAVAALLALVLRWEGALHAISGEPSRCVLSERVDCDKVQDSEYSSVLGVPLSTWGMAGNLLLILWLLAAGRSSRLLPGAAAGLALFNLAVALVLAWVSVFRIGAVCIYCTAIQVCSLAIALLFVPHVALRRRHHAAAASRGRALGFAGVSAVLVLAVALSGEAFASQRTQLLRELRLPANTELRIDLADSPVIGDPDTPHAGLLFLDFGCPHCRACYFRAADLVRRNPETIHFTIKHFPLEGSCNPVVEGSFHPGACAAAHACVAATLRGEGRKALDFLFAQDDFYPQVLAKLGERIGIGEKEWKAWMDSPRVRAVLARDVAEGMALDLGHVPVAYVDGRLVDCFNLQRAVR